MKYQLLMTILLLPAMAWGQGDEGKTISLWNGKAPLGNGSFSDEDPTITVYRPKNPNGTAVVICPGGGYGGLAIQPEGHGIAKWLDKHGIVGVVLKYRMPRGRMWVPLTDALGAILWTRDHAGDLGINPSKVGVIGFSAGGHLASTCATQFSRASEFFPNRDAKATDARPDFAILIYPVITMGKQGHGGSRRNLMGPEPSAEQIIIMSSELQVASDSSPTFLAHAVDDRPVPPANSQLFHDALKSKGIETRFLSLPNGGHGLNGYKGPSWDAWQSESLNWMTKIVKRSTEE